LRSVITQIFLVLLLLLLLLLVPNITLGKQQNFFPRIFELNLLNTRGLVGWRYLIIIILKIKQQTKIKVNVSKVYYNLLEHIRCQCKKRSCYLLIRIVFYRLTKYSLCAFIFKAARWSYYKCGTVLYCTIFFSRKTLYTVVVLFLEKQCFGLGIEHIYFYCILELFFKF